MPSRRTWVLAAVAALVAFNVSAESLTVGTGVTVTAESKAYDGMTIQGTLVIPSGSAVTCTATRVSIDGGTILLNDGAVLRVKGLDVGTSNSTIEFNGGRLAVIEDVRATGAGNLVLNGSGGDVVIDHVPTQWKRIFEYDSGVAGRIYVTGNNNLIINVNRTNNLARMETGGVGSLVLQHSGRTEINNGKGTDIYSIGNGVGNIFENREVCFGYGTILDMAGVWHVMKSLTGAGALKGSYVRFEIPQGGDGKCFAQTTNVKDLRKKGEGRLDVFNAAPTNLFVEAGEVRILPRAQLGYSAYRLKIDGVGTPARSGMKINSLALFSGDKDVSAGYAYASITGQNSGYVDAFMDGNRDNSWWYGYDSHGGRVNPSFDDAYIDIFYNDRRIVTGYKLRTSDTSGGDRPRAWRLFGCDPNGKWEMLDQRVDETLPVVDYTWSSEYQATIPDDADSTTSCKTMTMSGGSKLTVLSNATFVCDALSTSGGETFDFRAGSSVDLAPVDATGTAADAEIVVGTSSAFEGALTKSGSGTLTLTGIPASSGPSAIRVKEGTLSFRTAFLSWKYWKFVFCEIVPKNGEAKGISVGEVAVYGPDGSRLNVTGTVTMARLSESSFSGDRNNQMYDGIASDNNWGFIGSVPLLDDETTWKYTSFVLSDDAPAVTGYNLMSGGGGTWNCWPKTWKVYARENEADEWLLVDSKTNVALPSNNLTWYNGGQPWYLATTQTVGVAAFPASAPVMVDPGATLDLSHSGVTTISRLVVDGDATGYGTILGGTYAAEGTFEINVAGEALTSPFELPLLIDGATGTGMFSGWTVVINGVEEKNLKVLVSNAGRPTVVTSGTVLILR